MYLLLRKLALEMTFDIFTTQRVSCFGQYDRIDDRMPCKLRSDKCPAFRQFLVDEFHFSAVFKCFDPLFVWHFRFASRLSGKPVPESCAIRPFGRLHLFTRDRRSLYRTSVTDWAGFCLSVAQQFDQLTAEACPGGSVTIGEVFCL